MERTGHNLRGYRETAGEVLRTKAQYILAAGMLLSGGYDSQKPLPHSPIIVSNPDIQNLNSISRVYLPEIARDGEVITNCISHTILFADGLSGSEKGHEDRAFFRPVANTADALDVTYQTVFPSDRKNPEKIEWSASFRAKLEKATTENKKVILMGYSLGAREILKVATSLVDPAKITYNPVLSNSISGLIFIAARDNMGEHAKNHPALSNYDEFYSDDISNSKPQVNISSQQIELVKNEFKGRMFVLGQKGDKITPESQGKHLSEQLGAEYISVSAVDYAGNPDSHFTVENSGIPIAKVLETLVRNEYERSLTPNKEMCIR